MKALSSAISEDSASPDVLIQFANFLIEDYQRGLSSDSAFVYSVCLCRPESCGRVRLGGSSIKDSPVIEAGYFSAEADIEGTMAGLRMLNGLSRQLALAQLIERRMLPVSMESDEDLRAHIQDTATTVFHPCGTCAMGTRPQAVVIPYLRLRGVNNLRIAAASVIPSIPSINIHAATIMIAERAANMIQTADHAVLSSPKGPRKLESWT